MNEQVLTVHSPNAFLPAVKMSLALMFRFMADTRYEANYMAQTQKIFFLIFH